MRVRWPRKIAVFALAALALGCATARDARASRLTATAQARVERGETVILPKTLGEGDHKYIGGITYTVVDAPISELIGLFDDVSAFEKLLPKTKWARRIRTRGKGERVELHQGNALVEAENTLHIERDRSSGLVRFWLDRSRNHSIEDAWGYFRFQPYRSPDGRSRTLITYGVLVDLGPGLVRSLYEGRLWSMVLTIPDRMRRYVLANRQGLSPV